MQPHLNLEEPLGDYALLPGDPKRAEYMSNFLQDSRRATKHREFQTYTGRYKGIDVVVTSTGIGAPSTSITIHELSRLGVETFIRVGTCGYINPKLKVGDIIIVDSAIRKDGASRFYAPLEYPAVASFDVTKALVEASRKLDYECHRGMVLSADSFYRIKPWIEKFEKILAFEMECSSLFVQCSVEGLKSGAIIVVDGRAGDVKAVSRYTRGDTIIRKAIEKEVEIALEAVKILESKVSYLG